MGNVVTLAAVLVGSASVNNFVFAYPTSATIQSPLRVPFARRIAWWVLALSCLWIGVESWEQYLTGTNIFGDRRYGDGALTGVAAPLPQRPLQWLAAERRISLPNTTRGGAVR